MADREKPAVFQSVALAWGDAIGVVVCMPELVALAVAGGLASEPLRAAVAGWIGAADGSAASLAVNIVVGTVFSVLLAPVYIAVHRFILLGETTGYAIHVGSPRLQRYFGYMVALDLLSMVPAAAALMGTTPTDLGFTLGLTVGVIIIALRVTLLFPAVAVDASGASIANAMADAQGFGWRIMAIGLFLAVPPFLVSRLLFGSLSAPTTSARVAHTVAGVLSVLLLLAMASRLYQRLGDRLNGSGPSVGTVSNERLARVSGSSRTLGRR